MKANQKFVGNEEAVSPVIGVILMVAITVVLAAVVFILVNDLGSSDEDAPDMGFSKDNDSGSLTVVKAPSGGDSVTWETDATNGAGGDIILGGTCITRVAAAGPPAVPAAAPLINGVAYDDAAVDEADVNAGDIISGCIAGDTLTVRHVGSNTLVYETSFS